jgi:hypothetical protein
MESLVAAKQGGRTSVSFDSIRQRIRHLALALNEAVPGACQAGGHSWKSYTRNIARGLARPTFLHLAYHRIWDRWLRTLGHDERNTNCQGANVHFIPGLSLAERALVAGTTISWFRHHSVLPLLVWCGHTPSQRNIGFKQFLRSSSIRSSQSSQSGCTKPLQGPCEFPG